MENRRFSSFSSPTTQKFDFLRSEIIQLSTHHHLRIFFFFRALLEAPCRFFCDHTFRF